MVRCRCPGADEPGNIKKSICRRREYRVKRMLGIGTCIVGMLLVVFGIMKMNENTTVSIIGGADGPTSIFVAGKLNGNLPIALIIIGVVLLVAAVVAFFKRRH